MIFESRPNVTADIMKVRELEAGGKSNVECRVAAVESLEL